MHEEESRKDPLQAAAITALWALVAAFAVHYLVKHAPRWLEQWRHRTALGDTSKQALEAVKTKLKTSAHEEVVQLPSRRKEQQKEKKQQKEQKAQKARDVADERREQESFSLAASVTKGRPVAEGPGHAEASQSMIAASAAQRSRQSTQAKRAEAKSPSTAKSAARPSHQVARQSQSLQASNPLLSSSSQRTTRNNTRLHDEFSSVRQQQDAEYQQSLQEDIEKEQREAARQAELEQLSARKGAMRLSLVQEPEEGDAHAITLAIRIGTQPNTRIIRRFLKTHTLHDVAHFVHCHPLLEGIAPEVVKLCFGYRSKPVEEPSLSNSLEQFGIASNTVVIAWVDSSA